MDLWLFSSACLLAMVASAGGADAVHYEVTNNALDTPGGRRFQSQLGLPYSKFVLANGSSFVWKLFQQGPADRKRVDTVHLSVEKIDGTAYTSGADIHLGANYVGNLSADVDVKRDVTGTIYHEITHVWQWDGAGAAPLGLMEGIAEYVPWKGGIIDPVYWHWGPQGGGNRWDDGYAVTALFLDYCNGLRAGFVAGLNRKMRDRYSDDFFVQLLGKTVDQLWADYKAKYGNIP